MLWLRKDGKKAITSVRFEIHVVPALMPQIRSPASPRLGLKDRLEVLSCRQELVSERDDLPRETQKS